MEYLKLILAVGLVISPFWLVWRVVGVEGVKFLGGFFGAVAIFWGLLKIAHWAIEFVLVAIGFDKAEINKERSSRTFIFWR